MRNLFQSINAEIKLNDDLVRIIISYCYLLNTTDIEGEANEMKNIGFSLDEISTLTASNFNYRDDESIAKKVERLIGKRHFTQRFGNDAFMQILYDTPTIYKNNLTESLNTNESTIQNIRAKNCKEYLIWLLIFAGFLAWPVAITAMCAKDFIKEGINPSSFCGFMFLTLGGSSFFSLSFGIYIFAKKIVKRRKAINRANNDTSTLFWQTLDQSTEGYYLLNPDSDSDIVSVNIQGTAEIDGENKYSPPSYQR